MARVYQNTRQKARLGPDKAPWYVEWRYQNARHSKKIGSKSRAEKFARKMEGLLAAGLWSPESPRLWDDFAYEYVEFKRAECGVKHLVDVISTLDRFQRIVRVNKVAQITARTIDRFVAARRVEPGRPPGTLVTPATINKDLRNLRAALNVAVRWECLAAVPEFRLLPEPEKLPRYVPEADFGRMYRAAEAAIQPPAAWWRALFVFVYFTGWRITQVMRILRQDVADGHVLSRASDNKGRRETRIRLHPAVVEHLSRLPAAERLFPWPFAKRELWRKFHKIQREAGIPEPYYGFHDLRRSFATENAEALGADVLQQLMQHRRYETTKLYVNMARRLDSVVDQLHVPEVLK